MISTWSSAPWEVLEMGFEFYYSEALLNCVFLVGARSTGHTHFIVYSVIRGGILFGHHHWNPQNSQKKTQKLMGLLEKKAGSKEKNWACGYEKKISRNKSEKKLIWFVVALYACDTCAWKSFLLLISKIISKQPLDLMHLFPFVGKDMMLKTNKISSITPETTIFHMASSLL